jgi:hypothetical protein
MKLRTDMSLLLLTNFKQCADVDIDGHAFDQATQQAKWGRPSSGAVQQVIYKRCLTADFQIEPRSTRYHLNSFRPETYPAATTTNVAIGYQVATKSGLSSVQLAA